MKNILFPSLLFGLLSLHPARADELSLYIFPSPEGIRWNNPHALVSSTLANEIASNPYPRKHSIGHVDVDLQCESERVITGMTTVSDSEEQDLVLHQGYGLGIIFHDFHGRLEDEGEVLSQLPLRTLAGDIAFLTFEISHGTCERLREYLAEYKDRHYDRHYGLPNRPRYGEGAGCTAFGASFLELAGILEPEFEQAWSKSVRVPMEDIGGTLTGRSVGILELLFPFHRTEWAKPDEPGLDVHFYDPDAMYRWVKAEWNSAQGRPQPGVTPGKRLNALELRYDRSSVPTPTDPIWHF